MMAARIRPEQRKLRLNLSPSTHFWFVPLIVVSEIILFIAMFVSGVDALNPDPIALYEWGANQRAAVLEGQLWRLVTAPFIHQGIFHLCINLIGFWLVGRILEPLLGWKNCVLLLFFSTIVSSVCSFFWNPYMLSVGASGMVYGMIGALFVLLFTKSSYFKDLVPHLFLLLVLFIMQWVFSTFSPQIDHAAHIGGALAGMIAGILLTLSVRHIATETPIRAIIGFMSLLTIGSVFIFGKDLSNPLGTYQATSKVYYSELFRANQAWMNREDTAAFQEGIEHLNLAKRAIAQTNLTDMPGVLQVRLQRMDLYAAMKKKQFGYYCDYLKEDGTFSVDMYKTNQAELEVLELDVLEAKKIP